MNEDMKGLQQLKEKALKEIEVCKKQVEKLEKLRDAYLVKINSFHKTLGHIENTEDMAKQLEEVVHDKQQG